MIERGEGVWVYDADGTPLPRRHRDRSGTRTSATAAREVADARRARRCASSRPTDVRRLRQPPGERAVRARSPRARRWPTRKVFLDQRRRRLDRRRGQARPPPLRCIQRPARARAPDPPHAGLPRHARLRHVARRHRGQRRPTGARSSRRSRRVPFDSLPALEAEIRRVGPDKVAAFFCEPVIGAGGVLPAARGLHRGRRRPLRRARHPARDRLA